MRLRPLILVLSLLGTPAFTEGRAFSDDDHKTGMQQLNPEEMAKAMEMWINTTKPGSLHKMPAESVGEWDVTMKTRWSRPGTPAQETKGMSEITSVLNGRFVMEEFRASDLMPDP